MNWLKDQKLKKKSKRDAGWLWLHNCHSKWKIESLLLTAAYELSTTKTSTSQANSCVTC